MRGRIFSSLPRACEGGVLWIEISGMLTRAGGRRFVCLCVLVVAVVYVDERINVYENVRTHEPTNARGREATADFILCFKLKR